MGTPRSCETRLPRHNSRAHHHGCGWSIFCVAIVPLLSSATYAQTLPASAAQTIYLVGDAGEVGQEHSTPVLRLLQEIALTDPVQQRTLVFLGDNIYPAGLGKKDEPGRAMDELNLNAQIDAARRFPGKSYFIPGNHDWQEGGRSGWKAVQRQEKYIEDALRRNAFLPNGGCPGPEVVELGDNAVLVIIDSQWWLHPHRRPEGERDGCPVTDEDDLLFELKAILADHSEKHIIVAAHHPLHSYGNHGGHFPLKDHLFPMTHLNDKLWLPLPVIGSIYPLYRGLLGDRQDFAHDRYNAYRKGVEGVINQYPGCVFVGGHEHSLQYRKVGALHHVVSGAGSQTTWLPRHAPLEFGASERGFARITIEADGSMALDFFTVTGGARPVWSRTIEDPPVKVSPSVSDTPDPDVPATVTVVPNADLKASGLHRLMFGDLYRDVWTAPITVPVLDPDTALGGLHAMGMGGGLQTRSLRLKAGNGHDYVVRSIKKYPGKALVPALRGTFVEDIVSDGIAGSHPYAGIIVSRLADAVGVYHTNSQLVYVPDHSALGRYREDFANSLGLLEERPQGDWSDTPSLGYSKNLVGSPDLIAALRRGHDDVFDDRAVLRARLLDNVIGDWDRHDDQWRWATFEQGNHTIYRPIPRDRDQAFFTQNGLLPNIINRNPNFVKFQPFGPDIRNIKGQNFNARYLDRAYLTVLDRDAWMSIADSMREQLTDAVIERAVREFPDTAFNLVGARIIDGLKGRRDRLRRIAERHYVVLARNVNVVGSDEDEFFEVKRLDGDRTEVNMFARKHGKKIAKQRYYHRVFEGKDTREIRLYGLDGHDEYRISGDVRKAIKLRIIGGMEKDVIQDSSHVAGLRKHTIVYESGGLKKGNKLRLGKEAKLVRSRREDALDYDRREYVPDILMPLLVIGLNPDDGFFLGGGFRLTKQGFKVEPFKWQHELTGSYAFASGSYRVAYSGRVNQAMGKIAAGLDTRIMAPDHNYNFFGFGNRTVKPANKDLYQYRLNLIEVQPYLARTVQRIHEFRLKGIYRSVSQDDVGILDESDPVFRPQSDAAYAGGVFSYTLTNLDKAIDPSRGIRLHAEVDNIIALDHDRSVRGVAGDVRFYIPMRIVKARTVMALRFAASRRDGDIDPLLARNLGGQDGMRGLRRARFSGNSVALANLDFRQDLFSSRHRTLPFRLGLVAFADAGRVWVDGLPEHFWHTSVGGGIFISPLNMLVLQGSYGVSDDDALIDVRMGFFF
jgi:hypothetical protein